MCTERRKCSTRRFAPLNSSSQWVSEAGGERTKGGGEQKKDTIGVVLKRKTKRDGFQVLCDMKMDEKIRTGREKN